MFIKKEKMYLGSFIRGICIKVISLHNYTYKEYIDMDSKKALSETEYNLYSSNLCVYRLLLVFSLLMRKVSQRRLKTDNKTLLPIFLKATDLAFDDNRINKVNKEQLNIKIKNICNEYLEYLIGLGDKKIKIIDR